MTLIANLQGKKTTVRIFLLSPLAVTTTSPMRDQILKNSVFLTKLELQG